MSDDEALIAEFLAATKAARDVLRPLGKAVVRAVRSHVTASAWPSGPPDLPRSELDLAVDAGILVMDGPGYRLDPGHPALRPVLDALAHVSEQVNQAEFRQARAGIEQGDRLRVRVDDPTFFDKYLNPFSAVLPRRSAPEVAPVAGRGQGRGVEHQMRLLHISDFHEKGPRETDRARRARVLGDAWRENLRDLRSDGPFDILAFTGDIAYGGVKDEFDAVVRRELDDGTVSEWLRDTVEGAGCGLGGLYLVPGNHDIHRDTEKQAWEDLRNLWSAVGADDDAALSRWIVGPGKAPRGVDDSLRAKVISRQAAFRRWVAEDLGRSETCPKESRSRLGYRSTIRIPRLPFDVHIIGLDSAWLAGDDHDAKKLRVTDEQVLRLCTGDDGQPLRGLRLALIHHPLGDLADGDRVRRQLHEYGVAVLLSGHLHETETRDVATPDGHLRDLATGCLYQHDRYKNAVTAMDFSLDAAGDVTGISFRFRAWSDRGHWHDDDSLYRGASAGRLEWITPRNERRR